tara:strand:- start:96 stop:1025 length:930 start_codon:yes stop_codon:yes gene_type:complete
VTDQQSILTFYQFAEFPEFEDWKPKLKNLGEEHGILGTIILAGEGINATISGSIKGVERFMKEIRKDARFSDMPSRECLSERTTFYRLRINLRKEIVTLGDPSISPAKKVGKHIEPEDWNDLLEDPEIMLVDTRNDYEVALGSFEGAENPNTQTFRQWPEFVEQSLKKQQKRKVAMFCTGGIRCEKASSHLLENGYDKVYHLKGGILNYLEKIQPEESKWKGECFLFDHRVSVTHGLADGQAKLCFGCRWPLQEEDFSSSLYEEGVSCPRCFNSLSGEKKEKLRERHKQVELAQKRQTLHLGQKMPEIP